MRNWNTDVSKFKSKKEKKIWEIVQKIEYGLDQQPLAKKDILANWNKIKYSISAENKRLLDFYLWGKAYSLPTNITFWNQPRPLE